MLDPIADKVLIGTALVLLSWLGDLPWWVTVVILVRELGITAMRFFLLRYVVLPASRGGKLKTVLQSVAIGLYLLPLDALPDVRLGRRDDPHGRRPGGHGGDRPRLRADRSADPARGQPTARRRAVTCPVASDLLAALDARGWSLARRRVADRRARLRRARRRARARRGCCAARSSPTPPTSRERCSTWTVRCSTREARSTPTSPRRWRAVCGSGCGPTSGWPRRASPVRSPRTGSRPAPCTSPCARRTASTVRSLRLAGDRARVRAQSVDAVLALGVEILGDRGESASPEGSVAP